MKFRIPFGIILSVFVMLLLSCGVMTSASEASVIASSEAAQTTSTEIGNKTDASLQIIMSIDRETATTSLRSAPIIISADLSRADEPVPDGTTVEFTISSGTGTLSGATKTIDGIATVRLASTVAGTVIVSATAESVSSEISASFIAQPKQAIVKVATVGTLTPGTPIGGILASVAYTAGEYTIASAGVYPSGVTSAATTTLAANTETAGQVILALLDVNGIQTGEFATLTFQVADGFLPNISDFSVTPTVSVIAAARNAAIPGISVVIQSLTLR